MPRTASRLAQLAGFLLPLLPGLALGANLHVPGTYPTIQAAFDVAQAGDEVVLAPGDYTGDGNTKLTVPSLDLTIRSEGGPSAAWIRGDGPYGTRWGLSVRPGEGNTVTIVGIGFRSLSGQDGSAIHAWGFGSIVVRDCEFVECLSHPEESAHPHAGAVFIGGEVDVDFEGCRFLRNLDVLGAGLGIYGANAVRVVDCVFDSNNVGSIWSRSAGCSIYVSDCHFANNGAATVWEGSFLEVHDSTVLSGSNAFTVGGTALIRNCTMARNQPGSETGTAALHVTRDGLLQLESSIVRGGCLWGSAVDIQAYGSITVTCCALDSTGIAGWENITFIGEQVWEDPLFCDPEDCYGEGNEVRYMLDVNSPCTAWRSPCGTTIGALGVGCGTEVLGACCIDSTCVVTPPGECTGLGGEYQGDGTICEPRTCEPTPVIETGWGAIKARFR